jgi:hypothetical protein
VVRDHVHAHIHGLDHAPEFDCSFDRQLHTAAILEDVKAACACDPNSNSAGVSASPGCTSPCSGSAGAVQISKTVQARGAGLPPRTAKFLGLTSGAEKRIVRSPWFVSCLS